MDHLQRHVVGPGARRRRGVVGLQHHVRTRSTGWRCPCRRSRRRSSGGRSRSAGTSGPRARTWRRASPCRARRPAMSAMTHSTSSTRRPPSHSRKASGRRSMNSDGRVGRHGTLSLQDARACAHGRSICRLGNRVKAKPPRVCPAGQSVQSAESGKPTASNGGTRTSASSRSAAASTHAPSAQREGFQRPFQRIDQPEMRHASRAVDLALVGQVDPPRAGAQHLADPVGRQIEPWRARDSSASARAASRRDPAPARPRRDAAPARR